MKPISLYLHIPFCVRRCGYCNFYSTTHLSRRKNYTAALLRAIATAPLANREAVTVYFGGGTPSLLGTDLLEILEAIRGRLPVRAGAEITLEANPATIDLPTLAALRAGGFNRISFGLQADDDESLARLGRLHSAAQGRESVALARQAGFRNISIDVMLGTPGQSPEAAQALCRRAVALAPEHISAYLLKIEPDTAFGRAHMERFCADGDAAADRYLEACGILEQAGYCHYEISNFALPGYESRHNTVYWQLGDYLGLGPSAHSLLEGRRFFFPDDLDGFLQAEDPWSLPVADGPGGGVEEYLMLSLRLAGGLSLEALQRDYGVGAQLVAGLEKRARLLEKQGLLKLEQGCVRLTDSGFLVSNSVITYLSAGIC